MEWYIPTALFCRLKFVRVLSLTLIVPIEERSPRSHDSAANKWHPTEKVTPQQLTLQHYPENIYILSVLFVFWDGLNSFRLKNR
jgi:hypothetical protein